MEKKPRISEYREKLDKTLASPDLNNLGTLNALLKNQLQNSLLHENEDIKADSLEKQAIEVSNFLETLRSASAQEHESPKSVQTSHGVWKLKQDNEDFRVMYREGAPGTPYHTLLAEGYVDGPVDVCMCISWESTLYQKWWPLSVFPTFKVTDCRCLEKIRIGEQISSIRMKVPWPMSDRGALVHYFLFEYFHAGLAIVLVKSISDLDELVTTEHNHLSTKNWIPKANDAVMIDMVGGFALQKVGPSRSYFRTIATLDIKLDFVPPSLMNFISRQLVGSGFKLYQKTVASVSKLNEDYSKVLGEELYCRIRDALFSSEVVEEDLEVTETKSREPFIPDLGIPEVKHDKNVMQENSLSEESSLDKKSAIDNENFGEIEEEKLEISIASEVSPCDRTEIPPEEGKRRVCISPEVEQALGTLEKVISFIRNYRSNSETPPSSTSGEEWELEAMEDPKRKEAKEVSDSRASNIEPRKEVDDRTSNDSATGSGICSVRRLGSSSFSKDRNHNKITPTFSEQDIPVSTTINSTLEMPIADSLCGGSNIGNEAGAMKAMKARKQRNRFCCYGWH